MKKLALVLTLIVLAMLLGSFANQYFLIQQREMAISDSECNSPCWRNIIPGRTTTQEAYDLIAGFSDLHTKEIVKWGPYDPFDAYYDITLSSGVRIWVGIIDDVVALITLSDHDDKGIATFEYCVSEFGTPEFATQSVYTGSGMLLIVPSQDYHIYFTALNPQKGVAYGFDTYTFFGPKKYVFEGSKVTHIDYFDLEYYETFLQLGWLFPSDSDYDKNDLHPWVGYGNVFELYPYDK